MVDGIGCFVCHSVSGSDPLCEDPFNTTQVYYENETYYRSDCQSYRKGRNGLFPASACVKVKGTYCEWKYILYIDSISPN